MKLKLEYKSLAHDLPAPEYAHMGDAGLDLRSTANIVLAPGERRMVPCGVKIAIPCGYAGLVIPRSGLAYKHGISVVNAPGLIDSGYRGEIKVILINHDKNADFVVSRGDRIAQLMLVAVPSVELVQVEELDDSDRGTGGFGSSGVS